jgi:hypothetical protein
MKLCIGFLWEVPLEPEVFGLPADQCDLRVNDCALVALVDGDCSVDGLVEDLPHKLAEVELL